MGTRGLVTFVVDGVEKAQYNQFDMYPDGVGLRVLQWLREAAQYPAALRQKAKDLVVVDGESKPTPEVIERLAKYADTRVSTGQLDEWYVLLRETQGRPGDILQAGVVIDAHEFVNDSLFCEYAYVIDLDGDGVFEVYKGFQTEPHDKGRWGGAKKPGDWKPDYQGDRFYYPIALWDKWSIAELPTDAEFLAALKEED